jgi:hypothetical protein
MQQNGESVLIRFLFSKPLLILVIWEATSIEEVGFILTRGVLIG